MLTAYIWQDGPPQRVAAPQAAQLGDALWIDLFMPTADEIANVTRETGLAIPTQDEVSEIESSSRLGTRNGTLYLSSPLVSRQDNLARTVSAGFVLSPDRLITVRFAQSAVFDRFAEKLPEIEPSKRSSGHILIALLEAIVDRQADALEQVRSDLEIISHRTFCKEMAAATGRKREDTLLRATLVELGQIGDLFSHIRESQVGVSRIVPYVETMAADWLPNDLQPRLRTLQRDVASLHDFDSHIDDKLQFLLDATLGFISIAQNNVMKVLTVASAAGIPPVLVAGIYGMNFKSMPELDWAWGYPYGLVLIAVTTIIPLGIFRWRGWI